MALGELVLSEVSYPFSDLPDDMQVLVVDFVCGSLGDDVFERLKTHRFAIRQLPLRMFPRVMAWTDYRGREYAEAMIGAHLPPVLVCGDHWLDGRHRVWVARRAKLETIACIDLAEFGVTNCFAPIGGLRRKNIGFR